MKYIDEGLSYSNLKLLNAWIDRRLSGQAFLDIRDEKAKEWWDSLIRHREYAKYVREYLKKPHVTGSQLMSDADYQLTLNNANIQSIQSQRLWGTYGD